MSENFDRCIVDTIMNDTEILMQCLMDSSDGLVTIILGNNSDIYELISKKSVEFAPVSYYLYLVSMPPVGPTMVNKEFVAIVVVVSKFLR
jgi:hypothetical protein